MQWLKSWRGWRRYRQLDPGWKKIVFYSESGQDWHFFEPLVTELLKHHEERLTFVSSDPADPGLALEHPRYTSLCIPEGLFLIIHFQVLQARLLVLTMMDLGNLQLKKSVHPVHYVYLFHSMGSTHMVDHANSYDAYDSLFCVGPHHVAELRRREELAGLQPRRLFHYGHPRLELLLQEKRRRQPAERDTAEPVALLAPTWGPDSILNRCGATLIESLLDNGVRVILRPHHHTVRLTPDLVEGLLERFSAHPRFEAVMHMGETESLFRSDILICDWSAMAIEYFLGLEKPVLFMDLPRRIRNPDWKDWEIEPFESVIRKQAGTILDPAKVTAAPAKVRELVSHSSEWQSRARALREKTVYNLGRSVSLGAAEIVRLANAPITGVATEGRGV